MWSDRNHYHPPLVEKSSRGGWCRRKAPSSNFSLARCSNFRQHGKGNQIQSRENTVCSIVRALRGEALAPFHRILISLFKQESKGCRYSALDLIVSDRRRREGNTLPISYRDEGETVDETRSNTFSFAKRRWLTGSLDLMKLSFDETREEILLCLIAVTYLPVGFK